MHLSRAISMFYPLFASMHVAIALASAAKPMELKYFDIRGKGEVSRILFALAGKEYTDTRFAITPQFVSPTFDKAKESGDLKMNLSRAPVLVTSEGSVIGQSAAIERYLCRKFGFMGGDDEEAACIDCIAEHCRDIGDAQMKKGFSMFAKDKTDEEKATLRKEWFGTDFPAMLEKIEDAVKLTSTKDGFTVGSKDSYADVLIFKMLQDCMDGDKAEITVAASNCGTLNDIAKRIAEEGNVAAWIKERPASMF